MKKQTVLLLAIFCILQNIAFGQSKFQLQEKLADGTCDIDQAFANGVAVDNSGYYYVTGGGANNSTLVKSCNASKNYSIISKFSSSGTLSWTKDYGDGVFMKCRTTHDGYLIASGGRFNSSGSEFSVIKTDNTGSCTATGCWYNSYCSYNSEAIDVIETFSPLTNSWDGYLAVGVVDVSSTNQAMLVVKINNLGGVDWEKQYNWSAGYDGAQCVIEKSDHSGFIIAGTVSNVWGDPYILDLSYDGSTINWQTRYSFAKSPNIPGAVVYAIKETDNHDYIFSGDIQVGSPPVNSYIGKIKNNGNGDWMDIVTSGSSGNLTLASISTDQNNSNVYWVAGAINDNGLLMKIDNSGSNILLQQSYNINGNTSLFLDMFQTSDNGFAMAGVCQLNNLSSSAPTTPVQGIVLNKTNNDAISTNSQIQSGAVLDPSGTSSGITIYTHTSQSISASTPTYSSSGISATVSSLSGTSNNNSLSDVDFSFDYDCSGGAGYYTFTIINPVSGSTYVWDFGDGSSTVTTTSSASQSHTYTAWGTGFVYNPTLTVTNGSITLTRDYYLTYGNNLPSSGSVAIGTTYICATDKINTSVTGFTPSNDFKYSWQDISPGAFQYTTHNIDDPDDMNATLDGSTSISQTFRITISNNHCYTPTTANVTVYPFLTQSNSISWNSMTVSSKPRIDVLFGEKNSSGGNILDISPWASFGPTSTLAVTNTAGGGAPTPSVSGSTVTIDPSSFSLGVPNDLEYTWTEAQTHCSISDDGILAVQPEATLTVNSTSINSCYGNYPNLIASVSNWSSGSVNGWINPTAQLYIVWYQTSTAPVPGLAPPTYPGSNYSGYLTSSSNSLTSSPVLTAGTYYFYAALCIHRPGSFMSDVVYKVSPMVTVIVNNLPTLSLTGASTNSSSRTQICNNNYATLTCTASGSLSYTYTWKNNSGTIVAGPSSTSTFTPNSTDPYSSAYNCQVVDNNGCTNNITAYYTNITPAANITSGYSYICSGNTTLLTGNTSATTHDWHAYDISAGAPTGSTLATTSTYNAGPGTYQYTATSSGCSNISAPFTLNAVPDLSLNSGTYSPMTGTPLSVSVPSGASSYYSNISLYRDGTFVTALNSSNSYSYNATTDGYYHVVYNNSCNSGNNFTNTIFLGPACSTFASAPYDQTYASGATITGSVTLTSGISYYAGSTITVSNGATLTIPSTTALVMGSCTQIDIKAGGRLIVNGSIRGCSVWKGIYVEGGSGSKTGSQPFTNVGNLTINSGAVISDAMNAVYSENGGDIQITGCTFKNNCNHISIGAYSYNHHALITGCTFGNLIRLSTCTALFTPTASTNKRMIYMEGVKGITIGISSISGTGNVFTAPEGNPGIYGIETYNLTGHTGGSQEVSISNSISSSYGNSFDGPFQICIASTGTTSLSSGLNILQNSFGLSAGVTHPITGIYLKETDSILVGDSNINYGNDIEHLTNGIEFYGQNTAARINTISGNIIENNSYGVVIAPSQYPISGPGGSSINTGTNQVMVQLKCNRIWSNGFGIVATGSIHDQGGPGAGASNKFVGSGNSCSDILLSGTMNYYKPSTLSVVSSTSSCPGLYLNNSSSRTTSSTTFFPGPPATGLNFINSSSRSCFATLKRQDNGIQYTEDENIKVFPNPASGKFYVQVNTTDNNPANYHVQLFDLLGRNVYSRDIEFLSKIEIDASLLQSGVYELKVTSQNGPVFLSRVEIQK